MWLWGRIRLFVCYETDNGVTVHFPLLYLELNMNEISPEYLLSVPMEVKYVRDEYIELFEQGVKLDARL